MDDLLLNGDGGDAVEEAPENIPGGDEGLPMDEHAESTEEAPEASEALTLPGEDATPEELREFHRKLGAPEDTSGYDEIFNDEEVTWSHLDPIKEAALEAGLTPKQLAIMKDAYVDIIKEGSASRGDDAQAVMTGLRKEWGREYDQNLGLAIQTAKSFGGEALMKSLEASGLGNNKELIQTFSSIGKALASEGIIDGAPVGRMSKKDAEAKAQDLMAKPEYLDAKAPGHKRAVEEVTRLMEIAYPEQAQNPYI